MDKIVKTGLKIDLHIHSAASAHKDGVKVKNNTLENIGILIEKLNDNEVKASVDKFYEGSYFKLVDKVLL